LIDGAHMCVVEDIASDHMVHLFVFHDDVSLQYFMPAVSCWFIQFSMDSLWQASNCRRTSEGPRRFDALSVKLHLRHKWTNEWTDRRRESNLVQFSLKCDIWWQ